MGATLPTSRQTTRAVMWAMLDTFSQTFVSILAFLIVARLLGPKEFGVAALSFGVVQILNLFVELMLQDAVVQRGTLTEVQINSAFWWSVCSGTVALALTAVTAPLFAHALNAPLMTPLLRVMSIGLIFSGAGAVPVALLRRSLSFRLLTTCSIITRIVTGCSSAALAFAGAGAFSLVAQTTVSPALMTMLVVLLSRWRPSLMFSWHELSKLLMFGIHVVGSQIMWIGGMRVYIVTIGILFGPIAVGFYNIAQRVIDTGRDTIGVAVSNLSLSLFSRHQNDHEQLNVAITQGTELVALLIMPIFAIIGGCAAPLVHVLLTDKWMDAVPMIRMFAAGAMLHFLRFLQSPAINAAGRPDVSLLLSLFGTMFAFLFLFTIGRWDFYVAAAGWAFVRPLVTLPAGAIILRRLIGASLKAQVLMGLRLTAASAAAFACSFEVCSLISQHYGRGPIDDCVAIILGGFAGLAVHIAVAAAGSWPVVRNAVMLLRGALARTA